MKRTLVVNVNYDVGLDVEDIKEDIAGALERYGVNDDGEWRAELDLPPCRGPLVCQECGEQTGTHEG